MTSEQLAAKLLADVPRLRLADDFTLVPDNEGGNWLTINEVISAIARHLAPGDDMVERLLAPCQNEHTYDADKEEAAARLSALTAQVAELTRERDEAREDAAKFGGMKVASDHEAATLRDRLARMEGDRLFIVGANHGYETAMEQVAAADGPIQKCIDIVDEHYDSLLAATARAALTDGGKDE